ncbi:MAG: response regulator [Deltaproteobacteria bacterium]|uniref:Response regulator n=1 Tax=Candidatus Zymogenus saltonus TaxID=2844893 RepID=A0A9D8PM94_9DELT|nr:response regulator [Candidatus Zymogenus saltonus]
MTKFIKATCPSCSKEIFLDPTEVPDQGKSVICSSCATPFKVKIGKRDAGGGGARDKVATDTAKRGLVVVIEDSKFARTQIVEALSEEGIEVVEAETAEDGINWILELHPKVIIVDLFLGTGNPQGLDIIRNVRKRIDKRIPEGIRIITYTIMSEEKVPLAIRKMTDSFVHKGPTALFHLREEVLRLLNE